ncbi:MAG: DUF3794 domain-containing protein [Pelotomaculum sp.]|uniref:SipL SPOCS domain-containing protein n=1 Tax=Pelotomaculum thermopropionicum (strain DSM 13744 / JCM 10971 / SI) TaxID=370438 RepID=A5D647_PELTS|nr:DUF3794 domain-containing protein [Pelotomaculum sp.]BAF58270.1 hypothetical protein PTH_0089 [Pelotomaculum thermopropionicum SI]
MPVEFFFTETQPVRCIEIKVPVVVAESDVEVVVDSVITLPELAMKVDKIIASVRDLRGTPVFVEEEEQPTGPITVVELGEMEPRRVVVKKVVVSGTLHKQIFYVNKNNEVKHTSEDLTFSKLVELKEPKRVHKRREVFIEFKNIDIDVNFELQRASRLHQTAVLSVIAKAVEDRQIFVQTCPRPRECPAGNLVRDGGIEAWADATHPVFWGASNVAQTTMTHSGSFAAEIGRLNPALPGSLFQMVTRGIVGGRQYRLTFWTMEDVFGANVSAFTLNAEVVFYDHNGVQVGIGTQSLASTAIPDTAYSQVQFTTPVTDANVASALVRFSFTPAAGNTNTVKIDSVMLECVPL